MSGYDRPYGQPVHRDEGRLAEMYNELNARHFGGSLVAVPVLVGLPDDAAERDDLNGLTRLRSEHGRRTPGFAAIYISEWLFTVAAPTERIRWTMIENTLLHEMTHVAHGFARLRDGRPPEAGHGRGFARWCNRVGGASGWGQVVASEIAYDETVDAAGWPSNAIEMANIDPPVVGQFK
ncbi:MAG: SprT-like domain-containing protein [Acidimicrobiales bacterium]